MPVHSVIGTEIGDGLTASGANGIELHTFEVMLLYGIVEWNFGKSRRLRMLSLTHFLQTLA